MTGVLRDFDVRGKLGQIAVPALVTAGRYDEARPDRMRAVADELQHAELAIFENSSHMAFVEEQPAYVERARGFLRAHDADPAGQRLTLLADPGSGSPGPQTGR